MVDADYILRLYDALYAEQSMFRQMWEDQGYYVIPGRSTNLQTLTPGSSATTELYDSTPIYANRLMAARMSSGLTPQSSQWFSLVTPHEELNDMKVVRDWLDKAAMRQLLAYRQSNFYPEIDATYMDWASIATVGMYIDKIPREGNGFERLNFVGLTPGTYVVAENSSGLVNTVIRELKMEAINVKSEWGEHSDLGGHVQSLIDGRKPFEMVEIIHAILPREVHDYQRGNKFYPSSSCYIVKNDKTVLYEGGYLTFPCAVGRFSKAMGEKYGRGFGMDAMPDIKTLNKVREYGLKLLSKTLDPPLQVLDGGVLSTVDLSPGAQNVVRMPDAIRPLNIDLDKSLQLEGLKSEELKTDIKNIFLAGQMSIERSPQMTAGEYFSRLQENERVLSPMLGRVYYEYLKAIVERSFYILLRAGQFPPPPQELIESGSEVDIEFEGPLAKGQKLHEVESYYRCVELASSLAEIAPQKAAMILDWLDEDEVFPTLAPILGLNGKLLRDVREVQAIRDQAQQMQAQEQMKSDLMGVAEGIGKAAPALKMLQGGLGEKTV
jgi:hypothetical protein